MISSLLQYFHISDIDVNTDRDGGQILSQYATKKYENSLQYCFPEIAAEWHLTKNGSLTPEKVSKAARRKVWWHVKCGHEWQSTPNKRCKDNPQCPICYKERRSPAVVCVETGKVFKNGESAAKYLGLAGPESIYKCCRGEQTTAKGYHWDYFSED